MTTESEWAWIAGIVEGEGWIDVRGGAVVVQMTDMDVVERLFTATGGMGTFVGGRATANGTKPTFTWGVYQRDEVLHLLHAVLPWLGARRRAAAEAAIERAKRKNGRKRYIHQNRGRNEENDAFVRVAGRHHDGDGMRLINQALTDSAEPAADGQLPAADPAGGR